MPETLWKEGVVEVRDLLKLIVRTSPIHGPTWGTTARAL